MNGFELNKIIILLRIYVKLSLVLYFTNYYKLVQKLKFSQFKLSTKYKNRIKCL